MAYKIKWSKRAEKQFDRLDNVIRIRITEYLEKIVGLLAFSKVSPLLNRTETALL